MSDWNKAREWVESTSSDLYKPVGKVLNAPPVNPPKFPGDPQLSWPKFNPPEPWFKDKDVKTFAVDAGLEFVKLQMSMTKFGMETMHQAFNPFVKLQMLQNMEKDWNDGYHIRSFLGLASLTLLGNASVPLTIYDSFFPYQNPTRDGKEANVPSYGNWYGIGQGEEIAGLLGFRDHYQNVYKNMEKSYNWVEWNVWGKHHKDNRRGGNKPTEQELYEARKKASERDPWNP